MIREETLKALYCERRLSMTEIAEKLGTTHATVLYWLKKSRIPRRSWSESTYAKLNPNGDPFKIPGTLTARQQALLTAGLLLYWAEGAKTNKTAVAIGNLDGRLLQAFLAFLREVCHVDGRRLSVYVRVHKQFSLSVARRYWSRLLRLPIQRIFVYPHTDIRSKSHRQWSQYGLAILEFHNTKFKRWFDQAIETYIRFLLRDRRTQGVPQVLWQRMGGLLGDGVAEMSFGLLSDGELADWNPSGWGIPASLKR